MAILLRAPLTDDEACSILRLRPRKYRVLIASGKLACSGVFREEPACRKPIPTILDILHHNLCACVQREIEDGLIKLEDIDEILDELVYRTEEDGEAPGGGMDAQSNLYFDTIWLLARPPTTGASRRLATTLARTLQRCMERFAPDRSGYLKGMPRVHGSVVSATAAQGPKLSANADRSKDQIVVRH